MSNYFTTSMVDREGEIGWSRWMLFFYYLGKPLPPASAEPLVNQLGATVPAEEDGVMDSELRPHP